MKNTRHATWLIPGLGVVIMVLHLAQYAAPVLADLPYRVTSDRHAKQNIRMVEPQAVLHSLTRVL